MTTDASTTAPLSVALIGLGHRGAKYFLPAIARSASCVPVAVCDADMARAQHHGGSSGLPAYRDHNELLERHRPDIVIAAAPHDVHRAIVADSAQYGANVLKEKPLALNVGDATFMAELCDRHRVHLMVTLQRRLDPIYQRFQEALSVIGEPYWFEARYTILRDDLNEGWRAQRRLSGGGCILDMGYHTIDLVLWYLGMPEAVHAEFSNVAVHGDYDVEDTAAILMTFSGGLHGHVSLSRHRSPETEGFEVVGRDGTARLDRHSVRVYARDGREVESLRYERGAQTTPPNVLDHFVDVIRGRTPNMGSPGLHLQHMQIVDACYASQKAGAYVSPRTR